RHRGETQGEPWFPAARNGQRIRRPTRNGPARRHHRGDGVVIPEHGGKSMKLTRIRLKDEGKQGRVPAGFAASAGCGFGAECFDVPMRVRYKLYNIRANGVGSPHVHRYLIGEPALARGVRAYR